MCCTHLRQPYSGCSWADSALSGIYFVSFFCRCCVKFDLYRQTGLLLISSTVGGLIGGRGGTCSLLLFRLLTLQAVCQGVNHLQQLIYRWYPSFTYAVSFSERSPLLPRRPLPLSPSPALAQSSFYILLHLECHFLSLHFHRKSRDQTTQV